MVKHPAIVDSACLIRLERIGRLDLLPSLVEPVFVPAAVETEFGSRPSWMIVESPSDKGMVATLKLIVDPGESEAIALAYEKGLRIILDDRRAREAARRLGLKVTGTVGLLILAKQAGLVTAIKPLLDALDTSNFRISAALRAEALSLVGE